MANLASRRIPVNDDYQTCERTYAELRVYGNELDPKIITEILGVTPSSIQKKGEKRTNSFGRTVVFKTGGWFLSSEGRVQSKDVRRHLDWLLEQLVPVKDQLSNIQETSGITMNVYCIWWSTGDGGPTLWPEQMRSLADLNLECAFDISFYGDEEIRETDK